MDQFREFMAQKGLRVSRERVVVAEEVLSSPGPFTAEELLERLAAREPRTSRSTMYRTLEKLLEAELIHLVKELGGREVYHVA
jgi:Fur family ferric uptake transcriptional regulator